MIERTIGFIGTGTMATALAGGMLNAGVAAQERILGADPDPVRREGFAGLGATVFDDNRLLLQRCEAVVLSVKPNVVPAVAREIAPYVTEQMLVVSIAAGVTLGALEKMLGTERLVRVMPNTPARVGQGASAYCTGEGATDEDAALVQQMLGSVGLCVRVKEEQMDAVTGLSGSGPAYLYLVIEALADGGVKLGMPRDIALRLAAQTARGAAQMVLETGSPPAQLREQVTTPGGTTLEGLGVLEEAGMHRAFVEAVEAAARKSARLSKQD